MWDQSFEIMRNPSNNVVGAILGQRIDKLFSVIYYASKILNSIQHNYTTAEKEVLVVVFAFDKFRPYLLCYKVIVNTDHAILKYLFEKKDALIRWILLLREFYFKIKDKIL